MADLVELNTPPSTPPDSTQSHQSQEPLPVLNGTTSSSSGDDEEEEGQEEEEEESEPEGGEADREEEPAAGEGVSDTPSEELVDQIMEAMWKYCDSYSISNVVSSSILSSPPPPSLFCFFSSVLISAYTSLVCNG